MKLNLHSAGGSSATLLPDRGGLLTSLKLTTLKGNQSELLWLSPDFDAKESGWPGGGMPLMFPFAGRVFCGLDPFKYELGGKIWQMPLHGFAYAQKWQVTRTSGQTAELRLSTSEASRQLFPFDFEVDVKYLLSDDHMRVETTVTCLSAHSKASERMPFALGWHPYFRLPSEVGGMGEYRARLKTSASTQLNVTAAGAAGKPSPFPDESAGDCTDLSNPHLGNLILGNLKSAQAQLDLADRGPTIDLKWDQAFRYMVLWTLRGQGFHCVEPWMGLPDALNNGAGLAWLAPSQSMTTWFEISVR